MAEIQSRSVVAQRKLHCSFAERMSDINEWEFWLIMHDPQASNSGANHKCQNPKSVSINKLQNPTYLTPCQSQCYSQMQKLCFNVDNSHQADDEVIMMSIINQFRQTRVHDLKENQVVEMLSSKLSSYGAQHKKIL